MSTYLLQISIGPVQGFLAAARKTRDLKAGSDLLVELTRAAAQAVASGSGESIFPAEPDLPAANLVAALVEGDEAEVRRRVAEAKTAIRQTLHARWERTRRSNALKLAGPLNDTLAHQQLDQFAEVSAVWTRVDGGKYGEARARIGMAAAARKASRDFGTSPHCPGSPKSPLDPALDTVLPYDRRTLKPLLEPGQTTLKPRETLDAVSLIRRTSETEFPSTRHVANAALAQELRNDPDYPKLQEMAKSLRTDALELLADPDDFGGLAPSLHAFRAAIRTRRKAQDLPFEFRSYYAILLADGDRMGRHLNALPDAEAHRQFSFDLTRKFAQAAPAVVKDHDGALIYAGGDDVLAFLPMDRAVPAARELRARFAESMPPNGPTLSVGIAIVHAKEDLQDALAFARRMEKHAKEAGRNRLAIGAWARGGAPIEFSEAWEQAGRFERILETYQAKGISRGFAYEIEHLAAELALLASGDDLAFPEVRRIARRKQHEVPADLYPWVRTADDVGRFARMLRVGHFLTRSGEEK